MRQKIEDVFSAGIGEVNILPVVNIDSVQKLNDSELPETLPILALRNAVLFPSTVTPISIGRDKSIKLVRDVYGSGKILGAISQRDVNVEDPSLIDLYNIGTLARIIKIIEMPDGTVTAILQGLKRLNSPEIQAFCRQMKGNPGIVLVQYGAALAAGKTQEAGRLQTQLEKDLEAWPYAGDAAATRELLAWAEEKLCKSVTESDEKICHTE